MFDFAILIKKENNYILKVSQVTFSKNEKDLVKLEEHKIKNDYVIL
jgi:hypothetical protein